MEPSPALLAAQERLLARRQQQQAQRPTPVPYPVGDGAAGWLAPLAALLTDAAPPADPPPACAPESRQPDHPTTIRLVPDIAAAALRADLVGPARLWLLLRHIDRPGRGLITLADAYAALTAEATPLRLCGRRQLRNLLRVGQGIFWQRDRERIWLFAPARVAAVLQIARFSAAPAAVPLNALIGSIGDARAAFYATLHSDDHQHAQPIARATLSDLTGVSASSQRAYEARTAIQSRAQIALLAGDAQELAWQHGRALFTLVDQAGRHGPAGATWHARQLPNIYIGPYDRAPRSAVRRLNRHLAALLQIGTAGNDRTACERRYCTDGASAAAATAKTATTHFRSAQRNVWYTLTA